MISYIDATDDPDGRIVYPEYVDELKSMGFVQVGRYLAQPTTQTMEELAAGFGDNAEVFFENATIPTPVLRSPDGSAFAEVSWFWDSPSVRIRTMLDDGSLVETLRRWDRPPDLGEMAQFWSEVDIDQEMTREHNPSGGRSVLVVPECRPHEQWERHLEHVAGYGTQRAARPIDHGDLNTAIAIARDGFRHMTKVNQAFIGTWKPLVLAYGAVGLMAVAVLTLLAFWRLGTGDVRLAMPYFLGAIATAIVFATLSMPFSRLVISRVRSTPRWLRPAFRNQDEEKG
jgi:hypothetical protein